MACLPTRRGVIDVLRRGIKHGALSFDLFYGEPSQEYRTHLTTDIVTGKLDVRAAPAPAVCTLHVLQLCHWLVVDRDLALYHEHCCPLGVARLRSSVESTPCRQECLRNTDRNVCAKTTT